MQRREGTSWKDLHAIGELSIHLPEQSHSFMSELERADFATSLNLGKLCREDSRALDSKFYSS